MNAERSRALMIGAVTLLVWAAAAGSAAYWVLARGGATAAAPAPALATSEPVLDSRAVERALGAVAASAATAAAQPDVASRLALRGIVTHGGRGAALIAVDGKPAKPFAVGAVVDGDWRVRSLTPHSARLADGDRGEATLRLPPLAERSRARDAVAPSASATPVQPGAVPGMTPGVSLGGLPAAYPGGLPGSTAQSPMVLPQGLPSALAPNPGAATTPGGVPAPR